MSNYGLVVTEPNIFTEGICLIGYGSFLVELIGARYPYMYEVAILVSFYDFIFKSKNLVVLNRNLMNLIFQTLY